MELGGQESGVLELERPKLLELERLEPKAWRPSLQQLEAGVVAGLGTWNQEDLRPGLQWQGSLELEQLEPRDGIRLKKSGLHSMQPVCSFEVHNNVARLKGFGRKICS